jgi:hypothetical protein
MLLDFLHRWLAPRSDLANHRRRSLPQTKRNGERRIAPVHHKRATNNNSWDTSRITKGWKHASNASGHDTT